MKHWYRTLLCKITCFILCILSLCVTAASIAGAVLMLAGELYVLPKEYVIDSVYRDMLRSDSNNILWHHVDGEAHRYYSVYDYSADTTNIRYSVVTEDERTIGVNSEVKSFDYSFKWIFYKDEKGNYTEVDYYFEGAEDLENADIYTVNMSVDKDLRIKDEYYFYKLVFDVAYALLYWVYPIGIFSLILSVICFIMLMCSSARRPGSDELHPGLFNRVPIDLLIVSIVLLFFLLTVLICDVFYSGEILMNALLVALSVAGANVLLGLSMSIAARIKERTLLSNTLIWIVLKGLWKAVRLFFRGLSTFALAIPLIWRTCLFVLINTFIDLLILTFSYSMDEAAVFIWILKTIIVLPIYVYAAIMLRRLEKGGKAIAAGDLSFKIDTHGMLWDFRRHGENLNSISEGMSKAVEERLRSERMKTELITNVSHDIKTPITSIINYASLISAEPCSCEKHGEYSQVLVRKSEHLRRLLDDLVEASKASTGAMEVSLSPCDGGVLLSQVAGEFEERCASAGLELILRVPDEPVIIKADSRRIWRVFENLMSNACKYSLHGSRVYLTLERLRKEAVFTVRNTSKSPLDLSPEELTQRFVRGDSSRSTEGFGLGLSIASSLTSLQGGKMDIAIDGDLFKVTLRFPI